MLRKLLRVDDLTVTKVVDRVAVGNPQASGEIVDVAGEDSRGFTWEISVCRTDKVEPLHSRYEFARIVKRLTDNGEGYSETREMAVVYIGAVDHYGKGENIYTVRSYIKEMDKPVDDGTRIIFANAEANDGSEVVAMMQYFKTADPEDMSHGALSTRVHQLKRGVGKKKDSIIEKFFNRPEIVADVLNTLVYKENKVIADKLKPVELTPVFRLLADLSGEQTVEDYQNAYRRTVVMTSDELCCVIMGETEVDYGLPIKARLLEGGLYAEQESHQDTSVEAPKLIPVITLVFYLSPKDWEGHYKLSDMYPEMDEKMRAYAPEYRLNMVEPAKLSKEELAAFSTELGSVLCAIKNSGDEEYAEKSAKEYITELSGTAKELICCVLQGNA